MGDGNQGSVEQQKNGESSGPCYSERVTPPGDVFLRRRGHGPWQTRWAELDLKLGGNLRRRALVRASVLEEGKVSGQLSTQTLPTKRLEIICWSYFFVLNLLFCFNSRFWILQGASCTF